MREKKEMRAVRPRQSLPTPRPVGKLAVVKRKRPKRKRADAARRRREGNRRGRHDQPMRRPARAVIDTVRGEVGGGHITNHGHDGMHGF